MLFNYKNLVLTGALITFNAFGMEDKFNFSGLPLDMQKVIALDVINSSARITPQKFCSNLAKLRELSAKTFTKVIQALKQDIESGKNRNLTKYFLNQTLIYAIKNESAAIAKVLISLGADAKVWDPETKRPIVDGVENPKTKQFLLKNGAIENVPYNWDNDRIIDAACHGYAAFVEILINSVANPNAKDNYGYTALIKAAYKGHLKILQELITFGADIDAKENCGNTALMWAAIKGHLNILRELVASGADINIINNYGDTALRRAAIQDNLNIVQQLIAYGADVNAINHAGDTALTLARHNNNTETVSYLESITKK